MLDVACLESAAIFLSSSNFWCGRPGEPAVGALPQGAFKAVIAPSFADIFYNNCVKNGLLPIVLNEMRVDQLFHEVNAFPGYRLTVDLPRQLVLTADGATQIGFDVDAHRKHCLINGLDDIGQSLLQADKIRAFEARRRAEQP